MSELIPTYESDYDKLAYYLSQRDNQPLDMAKMAVMNVAGNPILLSPEGVAQQLGLDISLAKRTDEEIPGFVPSETVPTFIHPDFIEIHHPTIEPVVETEPEPTLSTPVSDLVIDTEPVTTGSLVIETAPVTTGSESFLEKVENEAEEIVKDIKDFAGD